MDERYQKALEKYGDSLLLGEEEKLVRAMLYGDFGSGKTTTALKIAQLYGGEIALITTDSAWTVAHKYPDIKPMVRRFPYESFSQVAAIALAHAEGHPKFCNLKSLIWDSVSRGTDRTLRKLVDGKKYPKQQDDPDVEAWPHYRRAERALSETIAVLNRSSLNIIYTAHVRHPSETDKAKQQFAIRPNMPEASYKVVGEEVGLIGWLHKESVGAKRMIQTSGTTTVTAKSQISTIPETVLEQTKIPELIKKWIEE